MVSTLVVLVALLIVHLLAPLSSHWLLPLCWPGATRRLAVGGASRETKCTDGMAPTVAPMSDVPKWPLVGNYRPDLFAGTAEYYAKYRVPYPAEMLEDLLQRAGVSGPVG